MNRRIMYCAVWIGIGALMAGCATGKTEFRVVKATPTPPPEENPLPAEPQTPSAEAPEAPRKEATSTYTVQPGDCLWNICRTLYRDPWRFRELAAANRIPDPDRIEPGQILLLSGGPVQPDVATPKSGTPSTPAKTPSGEARKPAQKDPEGTMTFVNRPNHAFGPGERLHFSVEYFGISAGYATLTVNEGPEIQGRATYHIVATARTHPAFEWIFKVRDQIESFVDRKGIFSWRYEKHLREGSYSNDSFLIYDQTRQQVIKDKGRTVIDTHPMVQDVLSEFYYYRTLDQGIGEETTIPVLADDGKFYEVLVKVLRREKVRVPAGEFDCLVVEPYLKFEGVFKHQGKIHIWLTNDSRRVPVLIKSGIIIGTIDVVLRDAVVVDVDQEKD